MLTCTEAAEELSHPLLHGESLGAATASCWVRRSCRSSTPLRRPRRRGEKSNLGREQEALGEKEGRQAEMKISGDHHTRRRVQ